MATAVGSTRSNGRSASRTAPPPGRQVTSSVRRRQVPLVVVGVLLVVGCSLVFAEVSLHTARGQNVLVVSQAVPAGAALDQTDLRTVRLSLPNGVASVPAAQEHAVLGQPAAVALSPGSVLTSGDVGTAAGVASGSDVVAVALKAGSYPPSLGPGDGVEVVPVVSSSGSASAPASVTSSVAATVLAVLAPSATSGSPAVVSLEVPRSKAASVASLAAAGEVALVEEGSSG